MKTKLADHDQFMTTEEALEYLQVSLRTVYRLIRRRNIPAIRVGVGGYLVKPFRPSDVMAVVARALSVPAA